MPLKVPFTRQNHETGCGAASLQMVLGFHGVQVDQDDIYKRLAKPDPMKAGAEHIEIGDLLAEARKHGLHAEAGKLHIDDPNRMVHEIGWFLYEKKIPVVACQRFSATDPSSHFRVIVGLDENGGIIVHDPARNGGGEAVRFGPHLFSQLWSVGGNVVASGPTFFVSKEELPELR